MSSQSHQMTNAADVPSPALLIYPDRVQANLQHMLRLTGGPARLRPHVKTHKLAEIIKLKLAAGIDKFKCATIAEAEMTAHAGALDVMLAYQPVGPNVRRFVELTRAFPNTRFSVIADDAAVLRTLSAALAAAGATAEVLLDVDCGMHRTGIAAGPQAMDIYKELATLPGLRPGGLHAYDGHNNLIDIAARTAQCAQDMAPVRQLRTDLQAAGLPVPRLVSSGTRTFPIHATNNDVECSPGTTVLSDTGTAQFPDLNFEHAALVFTRVISKPGANLVCVDLGHKAIASENPHPRVTLLGLEDAQAVQQSEEHLVLETTQAGNYRVGDCLYGIPRHICPTVALYMSAVIVENQRATTTWRITARDRTITI